MPPLFSPAAYEEDQPHARTILSTHVLHRGFQTGAILGLPIGLLARFYISRRSPATLASIPFSTSLLRSMGVSAVVSTGLAGLALAGRMNGREKIEWQERSWRLLHNKGQQLVDDWSLGGMGVGLAGWAVMLRRLRDQGVVRKAGGWKLAVGCVAAGNVLGVLGFMNYRYAWYRGRWED